MKETQFQKNLIDALKAEGGYGWKNDNKFIAGICDLTLVNYYRVYFVECKIMKYKKLPLGHDIKLNLTPLQRQFLKTLKACGARVGIVTLIQNDGVDYIHVTTDPEMTHCIWGVDDFIRRKRGEKWPVMKVLEKI